MKVKITQVFIATRTVIIEVDVLENDPPDMQSALIAVESSEDLIPPFDDARWQTTWDLQEETIEPGE